jgi:hypothetical protein
MYLPPSRHGPVLVTSRTKTSMNVCADIELRKAKVPASVPARWVPQHTGSDVSVFAFIAHPILIFDLIDLLFVRSFFHCPCRRSFVSLPILSSSLLDRHSSSRLLSRVACPFVPVFPHTHVLFLSQHAAYRPQLSFIGLRVCFFAYFPCQFLRHVCFLDFVCSRVP